MKQHRTILVTGASRGAGRVIASELVDRGHCVFTLQRKPLPSVEHGLVENRVVSQLTWLQCDLEKPMDIDFACRELAERKVVLDVVIHASVLRGKISPKLLDYKYLFSHVVVNSIAPLLLTNTMKGLGVIKPGTLSLFFWDKFCKDVEFLPYRLSKGMLFAGVKVFFQDCAGYPYLMVALPNMENEFSSDVAAKNVSEIIEETHELAAEAVLDSCYLDLSEVAG